MLIPMNPQVRTYYISVGSERELMVSWTLSPFLSPLPLPLLVMCLLL